MEWQERQKLWRFERKVSRALNKYLRSVPIEQYPVLRDRLISHIAGISTVTLHYDGGDVELTQLQAISALYDVTREIEDRLQREVDQSLKDTF